MAVNTETSTTYKLASNGNPDGVKIGNASTEKVGFYGSTPVTQQAVGKTVTSTGMFTTTSQGMFSTSSLNLAFITAVAAIQTALKNLGISSS